MYLELGTALDQEFARLLHRVEIQAPVGFATRVPGQSLDHPPLLFCLRDPTTPYLQFKDRNVLRGRHVATPGPFHSLSE